VEERTKSEGHRTFVLIIITKPFTYFKKKIFFCSFEDIERLRSILTVVEECKHRVEGDADFNTQYVSPQNCDECIDRKNCCRREFTKLFGKLQVSYRDEYALYGLSSLAVAVVAPMVKKHLALWKPLEEPTRDENLFREWKALLQQSGNMTTYAEGHKGYISSLLLYVYFTFISLDR